MGQTLTKQKFEGRPTKSNWTGEPHVSQNLSHDFMNDIRLEPGFMPIIKIYLSPATGWKKKKNFSLIFFCLASFYYSLVLFCLGLVRFCRRNNNDSLQFKLQITVHLLEKEQIIIENIVAWILFFGRKLVWIHEKVSGLSTCTNSNISISLGNTNVTAQGSCACSGIKIKKRRKA